MNAMTRFALSAAVAFAAASTASAQYVYVQSPPPIMFAPQQVVPVVSYSYYPPAPAMYPVPVTSYYAPQPTVAYYPAPVAPAYGVYSSQTSAYGLGIFRPRQVTTQYYYTPVYPR